MRKKIFFLLFFSILITNCDYSPIYIKDKNFKYNVKIIEVLGDNEINKFIIKDLEQQANKDSKNIFDIKINTSYSKRVLARNTKGTSTDIELKANATIIIKYNDTEQTVSIEEKLNYKKLSNNYEQSNYEKTVKKNIASSIARKLSLRLAILND